MAGVGTDIADYLKEWHTTEVKAIKGRELCTLFNLTEKQLRNVVSELRQQGEAVCSSTYGYWYSRNSDDLEITLSRLEGQVKNMNVAIEGLRKILWEVQYENAQAEI